MISIERPEPSSRILDIVMVITESWKLLFVVPTLAGLLGYGLSQLEPGAYESKARLFMFQAEGTAFSPDIVLQALKSIPYAPSVNEVLAGLKAGDVTPRSNQTATVTVALTLPDQKIVQPTLSAVLKAYQTQYVGSIQNENRSHFKSLVDVLDEEIAMNAKAIDRLEKFIDLIVSRNGDPAAFLPAFGLLEARMEELELQKRTTNRRIALIPDFLVTEKPSPAAKVAGSRTLTVTLFAVSAAIATIGIFLFARERVRFLAKLPGEAEKIRRIQRAFGFHSKPPA